MTTLFISDLHLQAANHAMTQLFLDFLAGPARQADALYILGDLFEAWIGDDHDSAYNLRIIAALKQLSTSTPIYFIHGNRDFLLGEHFAAQSGLQLLPEAVTVSLYGTCFLLMHGDTLCTDDQQYLSHRQRLRSAEFQTKVLSKPLWLRQLLAWYYRHKSRRYQRQTQLDIMDANFAEINRVMAEFNVQHLIHGHTHRPSIHYWNVAQQLKQRIVLSDWHDHGNVLLITPEGSARLCNFTTAAEVSQWLSTPP